MGVLAGNRKLSVLKYADDLVLCSVTSDGLQLGMNALHEFFVSNNLTVNTLKRKAMYVSGKIKRKLPVTFYNQKPLNWVEDFKYLGVHIARIGKLTNGLKNVCQQARRAQATLDLHIIKHPSVSIQHMFESFDCLIKPILCYGCEIYGANNYAIIETFHLKFMKHILDVKLSTNSVMVYAETGRYLLAIYVNMCMIEFWFKILNNDIHKLIHIVYQHLSSAYVCYWRPCRRIIVVNGYTYIVYNRAPKTEPCGTPQLASRDSEKTSFTHTLLSLLLKKDSNHWSTVPSTPYKWLNLRIHIVWSTVSKAAERSSELRTVHLPASRPSMMSLRG